ncbi:hypothetical protein [Achromobacter denitrificans]|uniref:Uncharacterized protein n=1 Tax=Achromobacter denitrificans TaxID=32002 RepID=A0ABZ3G7J5_ACHDE
MKPPPPYEDAVTFQFGDSPALADELLALVLAGATWCWTGKAGRPAPSKPPAC